MNVTVTPADLEGFTVGDRIEVAGGVTPPDADADLIPLARVAVCTPLVDAEAALNVLADELLQRGRIEEHEQPNIWISFDGQTFVGENLRDMHPLPPTPLEAARAWAIARLTPRSIVPPWLKSSGVITSIDVEARLITVSNLLNEHWRASRAPEPPAPRRKRQHRGINGAPLALRTKLKPWER